MARPGPLKTILFSLIPVIALLIAAEILLRAVHFEYQPGYNPIIVKNKYGMGSYEKIFEFSVDTIWKLKPNSAHEMKIVRVIDGETTESGVYEDRINSHGFRGPEIGIDSASDVVRIACLGDSTTFGFNVRATDSWPALLQNLLNENLEAGDAAARVQVINGGVIGYSSTQALIHYKKRIARFDPDFVVIATGLVNEVFRQELTDREQIDLLQSRRTLIETGEFLLRFRIPQALMMIIHGTAPRGDSGAGKQYHKPRVPVEQFRDDLAGFVELSRSDGFRLIPVVPPRKQELFDRFPELVEYDRAIVETAETNGLVPLRIDRVFNSHPEKRYLFSHRDDYHPTMAGYALMANILATHLQPAAFSE